MATVFCASLIYGCGGSGSSSSSTSADVCPSGVLKDGVIYYSNVNANGQIVRQSLDGSCRTVLVQGDATPGDQVGVQQRIMASRNGTRIGYVAERLSGTLIGFVNETCDENGKNVQDFPFREFLGSSDIAVSSDGSTLVYVTYVGNTGSLESYNLATKTATDLPVVNSKNQEVYLPGSPCFSPDGSQIYYSQVTAGSSLFETVGFWQIDKMNANGSSQTVVSSGSENRRDPVISDDGKMMAFDTGVDGSRKLAIQNLSTGQITRFDSLAGDNINPSWSADGTHLAYSSKRGLHYQIYTINSDGTGEKRITSDLSDDLYPNLR